ncbi:MAG: hypothetical protein UU81_C0057G0001, partial [Microgenomates group bacterium GW2011_GWC1_41_8]
ARRAQPVPFGYFQTDTADHDFQLLKFKENDFYDCVLCLTSNIACSLSAG